MTAPRRTDGEKASTPGVSGRGEAAGRKAKSGYKPTNSRGGTAWTESNRNIPGYRPSLAFEIEGVPTVHASKPGHSQDVLSMHYTTGLLDDDEWPADSSWYLSLYSSTCHPRMHHRDLAAPLHQRDLARTLAHTPRH